MCVFIYRNLAPKYYANWKTFITQRSERSGSSMLVPFPSECRESKVRYPAPWGGKGGIASWVQSLLWGIDTFHLKRFKWRLVCVLWIMVRESLIKESSLRICFTVAVKCDFLIHPASINILSISWKIVIHTLTKHKLCANWRIFQSFTVQSRVWHGICMIEGREQ